MICKLPMNMEVDVYNLPEDFETQVQNAFAKFTQGTHRDYTYQDKLLFIDLVADYLHGKRQSYEAVKKLMIEKFEYELDEQGRFADESDYYTQEFMEWCYEEGAESRKLHSRNFEGAINHHDREQIEKMLIRFIKTVIEFER